MTRRALTLLGAAALAAGIAACDEQLEGGAACPSLCPGQQVEVRDTVLPAAIEFDTALAGYPALGTGAGLFLTHRGDTLRTLAVIRFDTLTDTFTPTGAADTARKITQVDSAFLVLRIFDTSAVRAAEPVTFEAFDVTDTTLADSLVQPLLQYARPDRKLGEATYSVFQLKDSVTRDSIKVPIDSAVLGRVIRSGAKLRVGIRIRSAAAAELRVGSVETNSPATLIWDPDRTDTTVKRLLETPVSRTPIDLPSLQRDYADLIVVQAAPGLAPPARLAVRGLPGVRTYLRFAIPRSLLDSTTIVRATLTLTQRPAPGLDAADTVVVYPQLVQATSSVTDLRRAADLLVPQGFFGLDSLRLVPRDSGARTIQMVQSLRSWASQAEPRSQQALVLRMAREGQSGAAVAFFGTDAPPALRPTLRISFSPRTRIGLP